MKTIGGKTETYWGEKFAPQWDKTKHEKTALKIIEKQRTTGGKTNLCQAKLGCEIRGRELAKAEKHIFLGGNYG